MEAILLMLSLFSFEMSDKNEIYIEQEVKYVFDNLEKFNFQKGEIYIGEDTIKTDLISFERKNKMNAYLFCIARDLKDSISIFKANNIKGYRIKDEFYCSRKMNDDHFFIKQLQSGKIIFIKK